MKNLKLLLVTLLFPLFSFGSWYPHKSTSEIRFVSAHKGKITEKNLKKLSRWEVSGRLIQATIKDDHQIGGVFQLGSEVSESKLGLHYTYTINKLLDVTVAGDTSDAFKKIGGSFFVNLNLNYKRFNLKPFVNIDHKRIAELGFVVYFPVQGVECNAGLAYTPSLGKDQKSRIVLMFGTSFLDSKNGIIGKYFKDESSG